MKSSLLRLALPISLAALVVAAPVLAQVPPPPPGGPPAPGPVPPPPPPGGPSVILDHNGGFTHVDVHCAPAETTQACADLAARLHDRLNGAVQAK